MIIGVTTDMYKVFFCLFVLNIVSPLSSPRRQVFVLFCFRAAPAAHGGSQAREL